MAIALWHTATMHTELTDGLVETGERLLNRQVKFVASYLETGDEKRSAEDAGYHAGDAWRAGKRLLKLPAVLAAVQLGVQRRLALAAPVALRVILEICEKGENQKLRLEAARTLLDRAGHGAPRQAAERPTNTPLHELPLEELRALASRLETEIGARANQVESAAPAPIDPQLSEMLS